MKPEAHKRIDCAAVWKAGRVAACLTRDAEGITFQYEPGYTGPPVATTLPLGAAPVRLVGGALPPFFSGLLPEGRRLTAVRQAAKTSADDELTLLLVVGGDTIGDVQVLPADAGPPEPSPAPVTETFDQIVFAELFANVLGAGLTDRAAIPGAQDKVSGRMISLPVTYQDAVWILKLDPPEFPHLVENEAFFLRAARQSGIQTNFANVVRDKLGLPGLLVRRFDRSGEGRPFTAIAQEDACQTLGRYPADKYRLTTEQVIQGLARHAAAPVVAARTLLQQFAFAYLTCNGDAHGKNFSIQQRDGEWRVAPAYDLPSSHPYGDVTMALSISGKDREDIGRADFITLGAGCGIPAKAVVRVLDELLAATPSWLDALSELPFNARQVHKLEQACRYRARRLRG